MKEQKFVGMDAMGMVQTGQKGITNQGMIPAIKKNIKDEEALLKLFNSYPDTFISAAKYLCDRDKLVCEKIIRTKRVIPPMDISPVVRQREMNKNLPECMTKAYQKKQEKEAAKVAKATAKAEKKAEALKAKEDAKAQRKADRETKRAEKAAAKEAAKAAKEAAKTVKTEETTAASTMADVVANNGEAI